VRREDQPCRIDTGGACRGAQILLCGFMAVEQPQHTAGHRLEQVHPHGKDHRFGLVQGAEAAEDKTAVR
jgi:hypothetical protein